MPEKTSGQKKFIRLSDITQVLGFCFLILCILFALFFLGSIIYFIVSRGITVISWEFLTEVPRRAMTKGGVAPAIVGTLYLTLGAIAFALPLGLASAIYLCEYSPGNIAVNIIRLCHQQPGRRPVRGVRPFRVCGICEGLRLRGEHPLGQPDAWHHGPARHHLRIPGGDPGCPSILQRGIPRPGRHPLADHQKGGAPHGPARHPHRV